MIKFTVIKRDKDDLIWCPETRQWVDKRTDSAHFYRVHLAEDAIKAVPAEDRPELLSMDFADAEGVYYDPEYLTPEELSAAIKKHLG